MNDFRPKLVCFSCNFGWGYLESRSTLAAQTPNWVPVMCSGKVDAAFVLQAFREGADGVLILGCLEDHCHFQDGNFQLRKRMALLQKVLAAHNIEPERVKMLFARDPEGKTIPGTLEALARKVAALGPVQEMPRTG